MRTAFDVARWEFRRYFKLRQQLIGLAVMAAAGVATFGVVTLQERSAPDEVHIAVIAEAGAALPDAPDGMRLTPHDAADEDSLRAAVSDRELDGLLQLGAEGAGVLVVRREHAWTAKLHEALSELRRQAVLERENISAETLAEVLAPAPLQIVQAAGDTGRRDDRFGFILIASLMLLAIFTGIGYIFASVTGEKQIRVTEQILSAISAQTWIDGKIMGIAAVSAAGVLFIVAGFVLLALLMGLAGVSLPISVPLGDPLMAALIILFALLGLLLWLSFLTAVAAMIDDPHTSTRGSLLFIPMVASALGFLAVRNPDSGLIRVLALLPPTAPTVMPARMLLTDVSPLEPLLALLLLIAAVLLLRIAAARVFRLAMLMYGKEPTWSEVRRWLLTS